MNREDWRPLARELDWELFHVEERDAFPERISSTPWLSAQRWRGWDEPYRSSYRTLGQGTCFTVTLPPGASARPQEVPVQRGAAAPSSVRILVIEDDELLARALSRMLGRTHQVTIAPGGEEGLAILQGDRGFDIVLCDMMMPKMSGMEVYEHVLHWQPALARRMVFMTGGAFTPSAMEFLATVPNPTLGKPFTRDALVAVLYARLAELGPADTAGPEPY